MTVLSLKCQPLLKPSTESRLPQEIYFTLQRNNMLLAI